MERVDYIIQLENVFLEVPIPNFELPWNTFKEFPTFCGAGKGFGDKIVPDTIWGLKVSPACYIHDNDFILAKPTLLEFWDCNTRFMNNLNHINNVRSTNILKYIRRYRIVTYQNSVDTLGKKYFWKTKFEQGQEVPESILKYYNIK